MCKKTFWTVVVSFSAAVVVLLAFAQWRDRSRLDEASRHAHLMLHKLIRHVKGPWNPFAKKCQAALPLPWCAGAIRYQRFR